MESAGNRQPRQPTLPDGRDAVVSALHRYLAALPEIVLPVTRQTEGNSGIKPLGTAILTRVNDRLFVISAAHVFKAQTTSPLIHGKKGEARVREIVSLSEEPKRHGLDVDLAYAELAQDQVKRMGVEAALDLASLDLDVVGEPGDSFVAIGYPASKTKVRVGDRTLANSLTHLTVSSEPAKRYEELAVTPRTHLLLNYDRSRVALFGRPGTTGCDPRGMSGGIVLRPFRTTDSTTGVAANAVGVLIEYREKSGSLLIASRLHFVTESMRYRYPELRPYLPTSKHVAVTFSRP